MAKPQSNSRRYHDDAPAEQLPLPTVSRWQRLALLLVQLGQGIAGHGRDIAAWLSLAFALIMVLALLGWTEGVFTDAIARGLISWLGVGAWLVPLTAAAVGAGLLAPAFGKQVIVHWLRVIAAEIAVVCGLGLLQMMVKTSLAEAVAGRAGGIVGWSISMMMNDWLNSSAEPTLTVAFLLCAAYAAGLTPTAMIRRLMQWQARLRGEVLEEETVSTTVVAMPVARADTNRTLKLDDRPREKIKYTKRFTVEPLKESKSAKQKKRDARLPPLDMLEDGGVSKVSEADINRNAAIIEKTLADFGIPAKVIDLKTGPSVTQYAVEPGYVEKPGPDGTLKRYKVRVSQISTLANDLALALSANTIRIEAPVPGRSYVGIEVPNRKTSNVGLRGVIESDGFARLSSPLAIALGRDVSGAPLSADLGKMPHLLIAGTTGSGKSVCITSIITCLVMNNTPEDLRMVMIDPKMVELVRFNGLPHLYGKVEVELERIIGTLRWATREMDRRFKLLEKVQARDLANYNQKVKRSGERLPRIVILIDELADLMMMAPDETEKTLVRLAQMARATGLHLVVATQRPSTDIVTGLIKANFPARISFAVASGIDSRVILDTPGAESLLGRGDMLFLSPEVAGPVRLQGCFVGDREVERVVTFWKDQMLDEEVEEDEEAVEEKKAEPVKAAAPWDDMLAREAVVENKDSQIEQAIAIVKQYGTASASLLQRKMRIGYPRAARLMDELKEMGIVGREQTGGKTREVLITKDDDPIGRRAKIIGGNEDEE
ncbi:MAG TPA: DNA translocase FtsK [Anaerolineales bacterium]|nr:DNA translocase FtsK [Anaerolineales bacterium]